MDPPNDFPQMPNFAEAAENIHTLANLERMEARFGARLVQMDARLTQQIASVRGCARTTRRVQDPVSYLRCEYLRVC